MDPAMPNTAGTNEALQGDIDAPPTPPTAERRSSCAATQQLQPLQQSAPAQGHAAVGFLLRQALADPTQRALVLEYDELIADFLANPRQTELRFAANLTSYQRALAHRVGQYHYLETHTADYDGPQAHVVATRAQRGKDPRPRPRDMLGARAALGARRAQQRKERKRLGCLHADIQLHAVLS